MSLKQQIIVIKSLNGKRQKSTGMRVPRRRSLSYASCVSAFTKAAAACFRTPRERVDGEISFDVSHAHVKVRNQCVVGGERGRRKGAWRVLIKRHRRLNAFKTLLLLISSAL